MGEGRIGLLALPVLVLALALLAVWVVVFSREEGLAEAQNASGSTTIPTEPAASASAVPRELARAWQAEDVPLPETAGETGGSGTGEGAGNAGTGAAGLPRLWAHGESVTLVSEAGITGYATRDGLPAWQAEPPGGGNGPCAASGRVNAEGVGAVLYTAKENGSCSVVAAVDTVAGEVLWAADLSRPGLAVSPADVAVSMGETAVAVSLDPDGAAPDFHRFSAGNGEALALPQPPGAAGGSAPDCGAGRAEILAVRHAGSRIVALSGCTGTAGTGPDAGGAPDALSVYHADSGELEWSRPLTDGEFAFTGLLAGDPVLLRQDQRVVAYSENGEVLWELPARAAGSGGGAGGLGGPAASVSAVTGDVLAVSSGEGQRVLTGFGLADGVERWSTELPGVAQQFGTDHNGQLLLGCTREDGTLLLLWVDPASGAQTPAGAVDLDRQRAGDRHVLARDEDQFYLLTPVGPQGAPTALRLRAYER
ncbi:PQQ-binding-like beta-propeller repeat protein [Streptomyces sp. DSM 44917]|uniref:PQQ-binding-like beta-propeller repeat protein n=1 Tax=Streptomyces boetiae TaxID=3075541 RepID=A0ABU2L9V9_9ACTN|nr:PQQ-binding-like beta-propeller repeat protein [Streptomyces sp. DSM 44917]MDT0308356.1 PQQ-binding-like beta-propeller repeat protein [Streptomyces sp. DSM 44917]